MSHNKALDAAKPGYKRSAAYQGKSGYTTPPVTASDRKMTIRHLQDSIRHNQTHAQDHKDAEKAAKKQLAAVVKGKKKGGTT